MITYQVEDWPAIAEEASALWAAHYEEVGQNPSKMPLDPDLDRCLKLHNAGMLHIVTVRRDGILVGYHASIIDTLLHYRTILASNSDLYWLRKDCRVGRIALRMFQFVEESCRKRGVKVLYDATKVYLDRGELFKHLGYKMIEGRYSKWIGD